MNEHELSAGADIGGRYEVRSRLGGGGSAQTYSAVERATGRTVAIKVFTLRGGAWKSFELFEREAEVLARLDHPAIPKLVESFTAETANGPTFYLVETFVDGRTLAEEAKAARTDEAGARRVALELLGVLAYLQQLQPPVVHRDIKPANVLRTASGSLALVDFGSVRAKDPTAEGAATTIVGTYGFMAPEQYRGLALPATDLHGVGATLVFLLTGQAPDQLPQKKLRPELPSSLGLSPHFRTWLERLLEPAPEDRFQSAREAATALTRGPVAAAGSKARVVVLTGGLVAVMAGAGGVVASGVLEPPAPAAPTEATEAQTPPPAAHAALLPMPQLRRQVDLRKVVAIPAHPVGVTCVAASPDGALLVTGGGDGGLKLWATETAAPVRSLPSHDGSVFGCAFTADGKHVVAAGGTTVRVAEVSTGTQVGEAKAPGKLAHLAIHGDRVVVAATGGRALSWKLPALTELPAVPFGGDGIGVAISPDGATTALAGHAGLVQLVRPSGATDLRGHAGPVSDVAFSPDGISLASVGDDGMLRLWEVRTGNLGRVLSGSPGTEAWNVAWMRDGTSLVVGDKEGTLTSFRFPTGQLRWRWGRTTGSVSSLATSPDGRFVLVGSMNGHVDVLARPRPMAPDAVPALPATWPLQPAPAGLAREAERLLDERRQNRGLAEAEAIAARALEQNPNDALAWVQRARVARLRGYLSGAEYTPEALEESKVLVGKALALQPALPEAHALLAATYTAWGRTQPETDAKRFEQADAALAKLVQVEPLSSRTAAIQAELANAKGSFDEGRDAALRALQRAKARHEAASGLSELSEAYEELKQFDAADACFRRLIELDGESAWTHGNYAQFLLRRGHLEEAAAAVQKALSISDYPVGRHIRASTLAEAGVDSLWSMRLPDHAAKLFEDALKDNPRNLLALYGSVAVKHHLASQKGEACATCVEELRAAQRVHPKSPTIQAGLTALGAGK